jgi:hypothetical protein
MKSLLAWPRGRFVDVVSVEFAGDSEQFHVKTAVYSKLTGVCMPLANQKQALLRNGCDVTSEAKNPAA